MCWANGTLRVNPWKRSVAGATKPILQMRELRLGRLKASKGREGFQL